MKINVGTMLTELNVWFDEDEGWGVEYWLDGQMDGQLGLTHGEMVRKVTELMAKEYDDAD